MTEHRLELHQRTSASVDQVWKILTQPHNAASVLSGVSQIEMLSEGPYAVGTRWRETRVMMGRSETQEMYVTAVDAPHSTVVEAQNAGVSYRSEFQLRPHPNGTLITMAFSGEQAEPSLLHRMLWLIFGRLGLKIAAKAMAQDLRDLAAAAEAGSSSDAS